MAAAFGADDLDGLAIGGALLKFVVNDPEVQARCAAAVAANEVWLIVSRYGRCPRIWQHGARVPNSFTAPVLVATDSRWPISAGAFHARFNCLIAPAAPIPKFSSAELAAIDAIADRLDRFFGFFSRGEAAITRNYGDSALNFDAREQISALSP